MMYMVRFVRRDGKPDEEYYYNSLEAAQNHITLFYDDDSGLYKMILLLAIDGTTIDTISQYQFLA